MNATVVLIAVIALRSGATEAQKPPAVRALGPVVRVSADSLASAATAIPMSGGRVLVNDISGRRLLLFDSTLSKALVVADTTSATANAYGGRAGTLIAYRADSALYIDIGSLSMLVIGPTGKIERVMAVPRPEEAQSLIGSVFGTPAFDAAGRLVSYGRAGGGEGTLMLCCVGFIKVTDLQRVFGGRGSDSAFVVRSNLATRSVDTVASVQTPRIKNTVKADDQNYVKAIETTYYPLPVVDDWAVTSDGTIAIVRGRDYHVDWLRGDGNGSRHQSCRSIGSVWTTHAKPRSSIRLLRRMKRRIVRRPRGRLRLAAREVVAERAVAEAAAVRPAGAPTGARSPMSSADPS